MGQQRMSFGLESESIVCFAGEDWWYHHPHSKNHLLKRYARQNKVLFVNSITMGLPSMSNPDFYLKIRRKLKSYMRWLKKGARRVVGDDSGQRAFLWIEGWEMAQQDSADCSIADCHVPPRNVASDSLDRDSVRG